VSDPAGDHGGHGDQAWRAELDAWHAARVARLRSARGWLSLVGKVFLAEGRSALDLPGGVHAGIVEVAGRQARFVAAPGVEARIEVVDPASPGDARLRRIVEGEPVTDRVLRSDAHGAPDRLVVAGFTVELMERGDALALRVRDTRELPRPFAGIDLFPRDRAWRLDARFVPHDGPASVTMTFEGATDGDTIEEMMSSPGVLVLEAGGTRFELDALVESGARKLYVPFRDATSGVESYPAGRFLYAPMPDAAGRVVVDFNAAMLPGCAFSAFATCPIPPPRNRLRIAVRAGEKAYLAEPIG
jgi:uncharacterized protein (DUF1684 family)